jgi:hypothetical protein
VTRYSKIYSQAVPVSELLRCYARGCGHQQSKRMLPSSIARTRSTERSEPRHKLFSATLFLQSVTPTNERQKTSAKKAENMKEAPTVKKVAATSTNLLVPAGEEGINTNTRCPSPPIAVSASSPSLLLAPAAVNPSVNCFGGYGSFPPLFQHAQLATAAGRGNILEGGRGRSLLRVVDHTPSYLFMPAVHSFLLLPRRTTPMRAELAAAAVTATNGRRATSSSLLSLSGDRGNCLSPTRVETVYALLPQQLMRNNNNHSTIRRGAR